MKVNIITTFSIVICVLISAGAYTASVQYTYDNLKRLIKVEYDEGAVIEFNYDETGNRVLKSVTAVAVCEGDFDKDGDVDGSDLAVFAGDFGRTDCESGPSCEGDFDTDGDVDGSDLAVFAADFGRTDCP